MHYLKKMISLFQNRFSTDKTLKFWFKLTKKPFKTDPKIIHNLFTGRTGITRCPSPRKSDARRPKPKVGECPCAQILGSWALAHLLLLLLLSSVLYIGRNPNKIYISNCNLKWGKTRKNRKVLIIFECLVLFEYFFLRKSLAIFLFRIIIQLSMLPRNKQLLIASNMKLTFFKKLHKFFKNSKDPFHSN